jgi:DNA-binding CsgD family transcriptional regulator/PAS domain-containing protein
VQLTPEHISSLLQSLYAAAADPSLFDGFLHRVQEQTQSSRAYLLMADPQQGNSIAAQVNWDPYYMRLYAEHYAADDPIVEAAIMAQRRNGGDWAGDRTSVLPDSVYFKHSSYQDLLAPVGDLHLCGTMMSMPDDSFGSLVLRRQRHQHAFEPDVISLLNILMPHLKQSLRLHGLLQSERTRADAMASSVEAFGIAVLSVDAQLRIRHISPAASAMLGRGSGLELRDGEIRAADPRENKQLRSLITGAVATALGHVESSAERRNRATPDQATHAARFSPSAGGAMRITRKPQLPPLNVSVMPFTSETHLLQERPSALVFLRDSTQPPASRGDLLRSMYGITPTQARIADKLLTGLSLLETSEALSMTESTARFHLKNIFRTVGVPNQASLMRLMLGLPGRL